ncbi:hypothetical protein CYMTET_45418 [Cymbomonas tetramitiformis]|uniref:Uncharacterized protein n=1 Tax=Cymbomonas tetramitiformis TaxID=36881 RepID=A0AAE0C0C6_9CHLO|nr:hypothetical protein CYMTET_45418 [Cymbomonas tetramitiformis]
MQAPIFTGARSHVTNCTAMKGQIQGCKIGSTRKYLRSQVSQKQQLARVQRGAARARPVVCPVASNEMVSLAIAQQQVGLAIIAGAECLYVNSTVPEGTNGRAQLIPTLPVAGALLAANLVLGAPASFAISLPADLFLGYIAVQRFNKTDGTDLEWPGPKVWPFTTSLAAFLVLLATAQGIASLS